MFGRDRAYIWFLGGFAVIVAGFWPTFYGDFASNDTWHTTHGIVSTLWVLLLIAQSLLIGRGNRRLHERFGWSSLALFAILMATSGYMVRVELVEINPFPRDLRLELVFLDVAFLALFVLIYGLGLVFRRRPRLHARLMGSTILIGLGPALVRLYGEHIPQLKGLAGALPWTFWTIDAILVVAILLELRRRNATWPFPAMLSAFILIEIGTAWAPGDKFAAVARAAGAPV